MSQTDSLKNQQNQSPAIELNSLPLSNLARDLALSEQELLMALQQLESHSLISARIALGLLLGLSQTNLSWKAAIQANMLKLSFQAAQAEGLYEAQALQLALKELYPELFMETHHD